MTLTERLAAIREDCQRMIELGEKATPGPWRTSIETNADGSFAVTASEIGVIEGDKTPSWSVKSRDATFIAASRTFSPKAARAMLGMMDALETCIKVGRTAAENEVTSHEHDIATTALTTLCDRWGAR